MRIHTYTYMIYYLDDTGLLRELHGSLNSHCHCMYVYVYIHMCMCVYIYIYMYMHIHTYMM